jgi:3' exoribonuclease, RNase T-like
MANNIRISLDLETMSLENNAAIVQIAAVVFSCPPEYQIADEEKESRWVFNEYADPESSEACGGHVDVETMKWWDKQDPSVKTKVFGGTKHLLYVLNSFTAWLKLVSIVGDGSDVVVYCKGPEFDYVVLRSAYESVYMECPINFRLVQSVRTIEDIARAMGYVSEWSGKCPTAHDALEDAKHQANLVGDVLNTIVTLVDTQVFTTPQERSATCH